MRPLSQSFVIIAVCFATVAEAAAQGFDPTAAAAAIATYLDQQTIAVARLDLSRLDPEALLDRWIELAPRSKRDIDDLRPMVKQFHAAFTGAAFPELYLV